MKKLSFIISICEKLIKNAGIFKFYEDSLFIYSIDKWMINN